MMIKMANLFVLKTLSVLLHRQFAYANITTIEFVQIDFMQRLLKITEISNVGCMKRMEDLWSTVVKADKAQNSFLSLLDFNNLIRLSGRR